MLKEGLTKPVVHLEPNKAIMKPIEKDLLPLYELRRSGELAPMVAIVGFTFVGFKFQFPELYPIAPDVYVSIPLLVSLMTTFLGTVMRWLTSPHDQAIAEIAKSRDSRASTVSLYIDLAVDLGMQLYRDGEAGLPRESQLRAPSLQKPVGMNKGWPPSAAQSFVRRR